MNKCIAVLVFLVSVVYCSAQSLHAVLPTALKEVSLGTSWIDVLAICTNAQIMQLGPENILVNKPDPDQPQRALMININSELFNRAFMGFKEGILTSITIGGSITDGANTRTRFLQQVLSKCGESNTNRILTTERSQAVLFWEEDKVCLRAIFPVENTDQKGAVSLQLINSQIAENLKTLEAKKKEPSASDKSRETEQLNLLAHELKTILTDIQKQQNQHD